MERFSIIGVPSDVLRENVPERLSEHRREFITPRGPAKHRLERSNAASKSSTGSVKAYLNIDEVIRIIRYELGPQNRHDRKFPA